MDKRLEVNISLKCRKALSKKLKEVLPSLICTQQTAYVKNRQIGKTGRVNQIYLKQ